MKTCVVIPTFNESKTIAGLVKEIKGMGLDVLVVDDGSSDFTCDIAEDNGAIVIKNQINEGKGACIIKGFNYVLNKDYEAAITMDGDGQHLPQDISYFMRLAASSPSSVFVGNRMSKTVSMPPLRFLTNKFMSWLISKLIKQRISDTQCGFRLLKREVIKQLKLRSYKYEIESEILIKAARLGFKIESVIIETVYHGQKSNINPVIDTVRFIKFILREAFQKN